MKAFIVGSRSYGTPTDKSDIDLVIYCDRETQLILDQHTEGTASPFHKQVRQLRFGKLNVIACTTEEQWAAWKLGNERLREHCKLQDAPIDEHLAKRVFRFLRNFNILDILQLPEL